MIVKKVLVLGGCGFIGRNLVQYLVQNNLASRIKVVDKSMPSIAYMYPQHLEAFNNSIVEYEQGDLTKQAHVDRAFRNSKLTSSPQYDFVFNLAAETRFGQEDYVYESRCMILSKLCAIAASDFHVKRFIEVSTAMVYANDSTSPATEASPTSPYTKMAKHKLAAEKLLLSLPDLFTVIVRPVWVYGSGDFASSIMTRAVCAAAYTELAETMKFLWDAHLRVNTVHVDDVVRALWHVATSEAVTAGSIWNLADKNDTDQGKINAILSDIFGIRTGFHGFFVSNMSRLMLSEVVATANEKHLAPWDTLCRQHHIDNTPLSPFMHKELLERNHLYVDGSAIESTGFEYSVPTMTTNAVEEIIQQAIDNKLFPPVATRSSRK